MPEHMIHRRRCLAVSIAALAVLATTAACWPVADQPAAQQSTQATDKTAEPTPAATTTAPSADATTTPSGTPSSTDAATTSPSAPATAPATASPSATATVPPVTEQSTLRPGMTGPVVLAAQQRLADLGYWLGTPDGTYGNLTSQAVLALQKSAGLGRDGVLGPKSKAALASGVRPRVRTGPGSAIEVDKQRQLVLVVVSGQLKWALNTSTGSGRPYSSQGHDYVASTPQGRFSVQRQIDGERISHLGALWRPKYFTGGYALHGSPSVPGYPASHGCVRLSNGAIDMLWSSGLAPIGRTVWVY